MTTGEREVRELLVDATQPPAGLASRTFADLSTRSRQRQPRLHWLVGVAAVAIAAVLVATLVVMNQRLHGLPPGSPAGSGGYLSVTPTHAAQRPCAATDLTLRLVGIVQAMNQPRAELEFTNRGTGPCQMNGWPVVQMLDAQGAALPTSMHRATGVYVGSEEHPLVVVLQPGGHAFFGIGWVNSAAPARCEYPAKFRVAPPGDGAALDVNVAIAGTNFPEVCGGGALSVLPVQPAPPSGVNFSLGFSPIPTTTPAAEAG